ncbi:hypothetical protein PHYPSEUDO_010141 [Phytophthora pseudosyringae]|uniref:M96 mating-specific protein family n=1 Tax=Phytophthora pseudosyringae TaxID=221518 RepID=A0A8T1VE16_9STRA|nr:hypothetical protein PHYPSEUDO_010141 [Phytophthora pseudosyringae]
MSSDAEVPFGFSSDLELESLAGFTEEFDSTRLAPAKLAKLSDRSTQTLVNQPQSPGLLDLERIHDPPCLGFQDALELLGTSFDVLDDDDDTNAHDWRGNSEDARAEPVDCDEPQQNQLQLQQKRRARVSTKAQIDGLRSAVNELTEKLQSLEGDTVRRKAAECDAQSSTGSRARQKLWKHMAVRQLERREQAELDNATLRAMLKIQVQEANNLKRILKRRTRIEALEKMTGVKKLKFTVDYDLEDDIRVLQTMLHNTDGLYVGVDQAFKEKLMDTVPSPGKTRRTNRQATNDVFLELLEKQVLPFDTKATERAVWTALENLATQGLQCVRDVDAQVHFHAQHRKHTKDTMMTSHWVATSGFKAPQIYHIRKVVRKYMEADRAVFVCVVSSEPRTDSSSGGTSIRCVLRVVVRTAGPLRPSEGELSLIESHFSVSNHVPPTQKAPTPSELDMAIAVWSEMMSRASDGVESYLLDESIG